MQCAATIVAWRAALRRQLLRRQLFSLLFLMSKEFNCAWTLRCFWFSQTNHCPWHSTASTYNTTTMCTETNHHIIVQIFTLFCEWCSLLTERETREILPYLIRCHGGNCIIRSSIVHALSLRSNWAYTLFQCDYSDAVTIWWLSVHLKVKMAS